MSTNTAPSHAPEQNAEELEKFTRIGNRKLQGPAAIAFGLIAGGWSLFQLALPQFLLLSSVHVRCIHLAFAVTLVYLGFHVFRKPERAEKLRQSSPLLHRFIVGKNISILDVVLAIAAGLSALYLTLDYVGIGERQGIPLTRDLVIGIVLIVLLLEAARRAVGPALPIIAGSFIVYSFFSEHMPEILASKNASLSKVINKLVLSTEGIYGVPLDVSATTVFLFVLFGVMLDRAGGGKYFIQMAFSLLGRYKGGPAKAAVLASGLTGMVSGSSIANTVTTGTFTIPLMKKAGYPGIKAGAIEVAASTNGQLMPPIMGAAAFIMAEYCDLTYFEVVRAAFIPAFISYITLIYITHLEASKLGLKGIPKEELPQFSKVFLSGLHFLIPLGFLLYQLIIERRSPQLSAYNAIVALGALMIGKEALASKRAVSSYLPGVVQGFRQIWQALVDGGKNMMAIGVAVATAGIIVGIVTLGLGAVITDLIDVISGGSLLALLVITGFASLILGMGLPTTANYIVMASLTVPVIVTLGADHGLVIPLIAAHMFCFYFGILADDTPPVALAAYAASAISKEDPIKTGLQGFTYDLRTALLPFMFIFNTDLLLHNVHAWGDIILVFVTGIIAMFAFASLTQNYWITRNRFHESLLLAAATWILFRPYLVGELLGVTQNKYFWYGVGSAIFFSVYALQKLRLRSSEASKSPISSIA